MQPANLEPRQLVGLGGAEGVLNNAVQDVPVELSGPGLAFSLYMIGHEAVRQLGQIGRTAFAGFLARRIIAVRHRAQDDFGARSGVILPTAAMV